MARWEFSLTVDRRQKAPLFVQIARAIVSDITRGRLRAGDMLPGTRTLARTLGVQRQTVVAAFNELYAEGWIVTHPARGTSVSPDFPDPSPRMFSPRTVATLPSAPPFDLPAAPPVERPYGVSSGTLFFAPARPDVRLAPAELIGRAYRRAIRRGGRSLLSYAGPEGHPRLRAALRSMLASRRSVAAGPENICVTRGSQMAIALVARALVRPGDVVAVEHLGYRPAWDVFKMAGARVVPVPVDADGVSIDRIEQLNARMPLRAIYLTPHHQFPTTVTLSAARRLRLIDFAQRAHVAIVEDDYDHEFHYDGRPIAPLASADASGAVIYIGSLSKVLAPALRTGYVVGAARIIERIAAHRTLIDTQGDQVLEYALAELLEDGEIQRHVWRVRREYAARRDRLVELLQRSLGTVLTFDVPAGGIAIWARADDRVDVERWARDAAEGGVIAVTGRSFSFDGRPRPYLRLGFAALTSAELAEAVRRLALACRNGT
jgi:GntR family transcriptional regulator / MocR family aminotransferase